MQDVDLRGSCCGDIAVRRYLYRCDRCVDCCLGGSFSLGERGAYYVSLKRTDGVYVNLFMAAGIVFPSLFGWTLWKQELFALKICALALLIVFLFVMLRVRGGGKLVAVTLLSGVVWKERLGTLRILFAFLSIFCIVLLSI